MMRVEDMKPIIRIYTRIGPFKSFGIDQLDYVDLVGTSLNDHFIKLLDFNHLLVKTIDSIKIFKIKRH
jgi:hypothetical protein